MWERIRRTKIAILLRRFLPNWLINFFWHKPIALLAAIRYGWPSKKLILIGVTGTDGKTTTVSLINHILKFTGYQTASISTVNATIAGKSYDTGFHVTSPPPWEVQKYLNEAVKKKVRYAVLEVTSHALDQYRFAGCHFKYGVLTNIKPDHLDYHKRFKDYFLAKLKLFLNAEVAVLNKDDSNFKKIIQQLKQKRVISYSINKDADVTPKTIGLDRQPKTLPGEYNLSNILASAAVALDLGINKSVINKAIFSFPGVRGRFAEIDTGENFRVIIDFAHTPHALRQLLKTLGMQRKRKGRIITVFGCAAERGKERRKMGKVAAELADLLIITAEDPRYEGVEKISNEIAYWARKGGAKPIERDSLISARYQKGHYYIKVPDRQEAINLAVKIAEKDDIVAICGKGHEQSMNYQGVEYPWDEYAAVKFALKKR